MFENFLLNPYYKLEEYFLCYRNSIIKFYFNVEGAMAGRYYKAGVLADIGKNILKYGWPLLIHLAILGFGLCFYFFDWIETINSWHGVLIDFVNHIFKWNASFWLGVTFFDFFHSWIDGLNSFILLILLFVPIWIIALWGFLIGSVLHIIFWILVGIFGILTLVLYYVLAVGLVMAIGYALPAVGAIAALGIGVKLHNDSDYDSYPIIGHLSFAILDIVLPIGLCVGYYIIFALGL